MSSKQTSAAAEAPLGQYLAEDAITRFTPPALGDITWLQWQDTEAGPKQTLGAPTENVTIQGFYPGTSGKPQASTAAYTLNHGTIALSHHKNGYQSQVCFSNLRTGTRQELPCSGWLRDVAYVNVVTPTQAMSVPLLRGGAAFQFSVVDPLEGRDTELGHMLLEDGKTQEMRICGAARPTISRRRWCRDTLPCEAWLAPANHISYA